MREGPNKGPIRCLPDIASTVITTESPPAGGQPVTIGRESDCTHGISGSIDAEAKDVVRDRVGPKRSLHKNHVNAEEAKTIVTLDSAGVRTVLVHKYM
jgi:hypothetical protein